MSTSKSKQSASEGIRISIGAVSNATGIPVETLRTWERRYGFPKPERSESGHRSYTAETVERLRWCSEAISRGHRPKQVVGLDLEALLELVHAHQTSLLLQELDSATPGQTSLTLPTDDSTEAIAGAHAAAQIHLDRWLATVDTLDEQTLRYLMRLERERIGTLRFLTELVGPFFDALGEGWASGRFTVSQEHLASLCVSDFLSTVWRPLTEVATGPKVICTTLPGDLHAIGLNMASCVLALAGCRVISLGPNTPIDDTVAFVERTDASALAISVALSMSSIEASELLKSLQAQIGSRQLIVGGAGAPQGSWDVVASLPRLFTIATEWQRS